MALDLAQMLQMAGLGSGADPNDANAPGRFVNINGQQIPVRLSGDAGGTGSWMMGMNPETGRWEPLQHRLNDTWGTGINAQGTSVRDGMSAVNNGVRSIDWGAPEQWGNMFDFQFGSPALADGVQRFKDNALPGQVFQQGSHQLANIGDDGTSGNSGRIAQDVFLRQAAGQWGVDSFGNNVLNPNGTHWEQVMDPFDGWGQSFGAVMGDRANQRNSFREMLPAISMMMPAFMGLAGMGGAAAAGGSASAGGTGAGAMMPAAVPEAASTLQGWGLTQTAPGVWEAGAAGAGLGAGAASSFPVGNAGAPEISGIASGSDPFVSTQVPSAGIENVGAFDPGMSDFLGMSNPADLTAVGNSAIGNTATGASMGGLNELLKYAEPAMKVGGALYNYSMAEDMEDQMNSMLSGNEINWDMINGFMNDPMSVLRKNPSYLASVDYLTKEGKRKMAQQGFNNSGNINYYLADVLGKNANQWYKDQWQTVKDASGLSMGPQMAQVQTNALSQINKTKQEALGSLGKAGRDMLPSIFKWALS